MFKSWSKIVLVSMLVIVIAAPAFATTARVRSLAGTGDYLSDDSNIFRWYSTLPSYANLVQAELGSWYGGEWLGATAPAQYDYGVLSDTRALGFNYACGEDGKWGTYRITLHENKIDHPGFYLVNPLVWGLSPEAVASNGIVNQFNDTPVNKWDLAGGWEIGENFVLGVSYTRSSFKVDNQQDDPNEEHSMSWSTYGVGATWSNNDNMLLDAAFTLAMAGGSSEIKSDPTVKVEWDKSTAFDFAARLFYDWKDYVTVVPLFEYAQSEYALKSSVDGAITAPHGDKVMGFVVGAGLDIEVNGSNTLIFAAEYNYGKWEDSMTDSTSVEYTFNTLPAFRLALETEITSWLTTRVGAIHRNVSYTSKDNSGELKWTNDPDYSGTAVTFDDMSSFEWFLGCGFNVAEWTIDMELAPETPFSLGYWLTGYSAWDYLEGYGPVGRISATYGF